MKKERAITIKNPRLERIRNEFRILLKLWVADIRTSLRERNTSVETQNEISRLNLMESLSICGCLFCGRSDKNMIYRPDMKQWLCIECNSELVYFAKLRTELQMNGGEIQEFLKRLEGEEGIGIESIKRSGFKCGGPSYPLSKKILNRMGVKQEVQDQFFQLCQHYGGYCDCEIVLNAAPRFLNE